MTDWIKKNPMAISLAVASLALLFVNLAVAGCQVSDLVKVEVPDGVKTAVGVDGVVTLTDVPDVWDDWKDFVEKNTKRFESETERSYEILGFINGATQMALSAAGTAAPAFPGGAILLSLLSGAAGLYMKKPGTDRAIAKEKEASYNAGLEKAKSLAASVNEAVEVEA